MKYYIFRETSENGLIVEPYAVKSSDYATAEAAFKLQTGFSTGSQLDYREREVTEFEKYYRELRLGEVHSIFGLERG